MLQRWRNELSKSENLYREKAWKKFSPDGGKQIMMFSTKQSRTASNRASSDSKKGYDPQKMTFWNQLIPDLLIGSSNLYWQKEYSENCFYV